MKIITLDFESYWDSKEYTLSKMGPLEYIRDQRFYALMMGVCIDQNPVQVYDHDDIPAVLRALALDKTDRMVVGHNLNGFDALILSEIYDVHPAWLLDTIVMMRWLGLSRISGESHSALTKLLNTGSKWEGTVLSDGKYRREHFTSDEWFRFRKYCGEDVEQCRDNFYKMIQFMMPDAVKFATLTAKMATEPMFLLDKDLLVQHLAELEEETAQAMESVSHLFRFDSKDGFLKAVRSPTVFPAMLRQLGVEPPVKFSAAKTATYKAKCEAEYVALTSIAERTVDQQNRVIQLQNIEVSEEGYNQYTPAMSKTDLEFQDLLNHPDPRVALLVQTRLEQNSSIQKSRTQRLLNFADSRPLPILLSAFKAHTSRYTAGNEGTSDGLNFQNFGKRDKKKATLRKAIKVPSGMKLVAADASQIEARLLAYMADETTVLTAFANKEDVYSQLAERTFSGTEWRAISAGAKAGDEDCKKMRNVGKVGVLSAGYMVGWKKYSDTLLRQGIRLHPDLDKHRELAKDAHNIYRMSNPNIMAFWGKCQQVIEHMYQGGSGTFGGPKEDLFKYGTMPIPCTDKTCPSIYMPTGYVLRYPNLRPEMEEGKKRPQFFYDRQRGRSVVKTRLYGGALTENLTQGLSFQLLTWQAIRMWDEAGIRAVTNNHDCWVTIVLEALAESTRETMIHYMTRVPFWMEGFPIAAEGGIADDFTIA